MPIDIDSLSSTEAFHLMGLVLAQNGDVHTELGFPIQEQALLAIAQKFGRKKNTLKNNRDSFDRLTDSTRMGWDGPLRPGLQPTWDHYGSLPRAELIAAGLEIIKKDWSDLPVIDEENSQEDHGNIDDQVLQGFALDGFSVEIETGVMIWAIRTKAGRIFKLSIHDLVTAFSEIIAYWDEWTLAHLNVCAVNPDKTMKKFSEDYFSDAAHKTLANDQRRGFCNLISSIAYLAENDGPFDEAAARNPIPRSAYERALSALAERSKATLLPKEVKIPEVLSPSEAKAAAIGRNKIYYGAPGTGKSHKVDNLVGQANVVRTVFHADTQNSDFFGSLKPMMTQAGVSYGFSPGPFSRALRAAMLNPEHQHFLVIEELNRAPAASVFGELFQLLDRKNGVSCYAVDFPTEESRAWFNAASVVVDKLSLPANLDILATMNSADQGVFPLDTAFRRRWDQEYLPLYTHHAPQGAIRYKADSSVEWMTFIRTLNTFLLERLDIAEDRLLGAWFVKEEELGGAVPEKILLYLWDDLLRHEGRGLIFAPEYRSYGEIAAGRSAGKSIFAPELIARLMQVAPTPDPAADSVTLEGGPILAEPLNDEQ